MNTKKNSCLLVLLLILSTGWAYAESIRFAVLSDTQGSDALNPVNETIFAQTVQRVLSADPAVQFVIVVGDLVRGIKYDPAMKQQFKLWRNIAQPWYDSDFIGLKVYPVPGNHDQPNPLSYKKIWQDAFPELPENGPKTELKMTYSFDAGPCHFTVVNTANPNYGFNHRVNLDWLTNDLESSDKPTKFVFGHYPAYPYASHIGESLDYYPEDRDAFWNILAANSVKAYFCGHTHIYDHWIKNNVHQIDDGSSGGSTSEYLYLIVDADETDATVSVYKTETNELKYSYKLSQTDGVANEDRIAPEHQPVSFFETLPCYQFLIVLMGLFYLAAMKLRN